MFFEIVFVVHLFLTTLNGESLEEMSPFMYSNAGNAVNFNDIYSITNSLSGNNAVPDLKEDEYNIHIIPSQLVEFSTKTTTEFYTTPITAIPLPKYVQNIQLLKNSRKPMTSTIAKITPYNNRLSNIDGATKNNYFTNIFTNDGSYTPNLPAEKQQVKEVVVDTTTTTTTTTTTQAPTTTTTRIPAHRERGILDLLFPPKRVQTFKSMFDTVKSILSYTFKR
ncbi:phosphatidylinositol 4-kinase-like [Plodia interpunctella]|uniref:phosphatidylinositol 4-kinase-like n=1 Tax=Plodia interpunctella TaxID=58824 RepID=UPI002367BC70|nr:phosphatidylinositol 4-kinase-like [Plodia interpunctella]